MILTSANDVRDAWERIRPTHAAVAFVGNDWQQYVSAESVTEVVVSPNVGSNPYAILELTKVLGMERVHLLDDLHAKVYVGPKSAMLGSFNLSANGFGDGRLIEVGIEITGKEELTVLKRKYEELKRTAMAMYPSEADKRARLRRSLREWNKNPHPPNGPTKGPPSLKDFEPIADDDFSVTWYEAGGVQVNQAAIAKKCPEAAEHGVLPFFRTYLQFAASDQVQQGDWVLMWKCRDDGFPVGGKRGMEWMYVDLVVSNGMEDKEYPKFAGEFQKRYRRQPLPQKPFELDEPTIVAIKQVLAEQKFSVFREQDDEGPIWRLSRTRRRFRAFVDAAKGVL